MKPTIILDCYTDEPSGYGVRPYLGPHQINLSQALSSLGVQHQYLTIDDLRWARGEHSEREDNPRILHITRNSESADRLISDADVIYVIMGCFVEYEYFAAVPPSVNELSALLGKTQAPIVLFLVNALPSDVDDTLRSKMAWAADIQVGNPYRYVTEGPPRTPDGQMPPNYDLMDGFSAADPQVLGDLIEPVIAEIETGAGCNRPTCSYCIEAARRYRTVYRRPDRVVRQIEQLYASGVRHFRLGRQPNFYHYAKGNVDALHRLLSSIRESCSDIEMLHIDNVNMLDVITPTGRAFTELLVRYCTSGNVAPFGIESFDDRVRIANGIAGSSAQALEAIRILNEYGSARGSDGLPLLLPGINLMSGLRGEDEGTHYCNLSSLAEILKSGLMTARLFYRPLTPMEGISLLRKPVVPSESHTRQFKEIVDSFVLPMQSRTLPPGHIVRGLREVRNDSTAASLRAFATCSTRYRTSELKLDRDRTYDVVVTGNLGYREVSADVLSGQVIR